MRRALTRIDAKAISLAFGMFFLPAGFDALFALVMKWTGSYWITDGIFYGVSLSFFGLYSWLSRRDKMRSSD